MLIILLLTIASLAIALPLLIRKFAFLKADLPLTSEWIDELSTDRYRPMMRLLDNEDLEFLRTQPCYTPAMESRLRAQRCEIFRGYLSCLQTDFARVCTALKLILVQARQDRPDLAATLLQSQAMFTCAVLSVQARVFLYRWGLTTVNASDLVKIFDGMRIELRTLVPAELPLSA